MNNFSIREFQRYWCHICQQDKILQKCQGHFICQQCNNDFLEEINTHNNSDDDPRNFKPYTTDENIRSNTQNRQPGSVNSNNSENISIREIGQIRLRNIPQIFSSQSFVDMIIEQLFQRSETLSHFNDEDDFSNILNYLLENTERLRNPAPKESIDKLGRRKFQSGQQMEETECPVCQEEFKENEEIIEMPCKHSFHEVCLLKWLKENNSCPTCRYEIPSRNLNNLTGQEEFESQNE